MFAIILADTNDAGLEPLTSRVPHALLPLVGKPILVHLLEQLHRNNITDVMVVSPDHHDRLARSIDTGPLLGMRISFASELPDLRRNPDDTLVIGSRYLVDLNWRLITEGLSENNGCKNSMMITSSSKPVALIIPPGASDLVPDNWADVEQMVIPRVSVDNPPVLSINSLKNYVDASFRLLDEKFQHFFPAGRQNMAGLYLSPKATVKTQSLQSNNAYVGSYSRIDAAATLHGDVVVGEKVVIDKGASISNSIILDGTYVGAMTRCNNAIIHQNLLIRVDSGICVEINDPVLVSAC